MKIKALMAQPELVKLAQKCMANEEARYGANRMNIDYGHWTREIWARMTPEERQKRGKSISLGKKRAGSQP